VNIYKSHYDKFLIDDGQLLPPINSIDGVGQNAAVSLYEARKNGEFISIQDLSDRTKLTSTSIDALKEHGSLGNLPELNQLSMF
jgi:DNA polymerase-3 subunit alpha (Gram-positive type)